MNKSSFLQQHWEHYWMKARRKEQQAHRELEMTNGFVKYDSLQKSDNDLIPFVKINPANTYIPNNQKCPSIPWTLFLTFKGMLIPAIIMNLIQVLMQFISPQILKYK